MEGLASSNNALTNSHPPGDKLVCKNMCFPQWKCHTGLVELSVRFASIENEHNGSYRTKTAALTGGRDDFVLQFFFHQEKKADTRSVQPCTVSSLGRHFYSAAWHFRTKECESLTFDEGFWFLLSPLMKL
jgi:hypothetical protein